MSEQGCARTPCRRSEHGPRVQMVRGSGGWLVLAMGGSVPPGSSCLGGRGRPRGLPGLQLARNAKQKRLSTFALRISSQIGLLTQNSERASSQPADPGDGARDGLDAPAHCSALGLSSPTRSGQRQVDISRQL
jgi:hypothetical protein